MKIVVLGHNGLLGNAVYKFFECVNFDVITLKERWPSEDFKTKLKSIEAGYLINCIGNIPQKKRTEDYELLNYELPLWLDANVSPRIIHPTTDCEFKGNPQEFFQYTVRDRRDAIDDYGRSKAKLSETLERRSERTKLIRTSIIGLEKDSSFSLLNWFLSQTASVDGFANHYWNGITTLEWSKQCLQLILEWDSRPLVNQIGTSVVHSKYELLVLFREVFGKAIKIKMKSTEIVNKTLTPDLCAKHIFLQLKELKAFYEFNSEKKPALMF